VVPLAIARWSPTPWRPAIYTTLWDTTGGVLEDAVGERPAMNPRPSAGCWVRWVP